MSMGLKKICLCKRGKRSLPTSICLMVARSSQISLSTYVDHCVLPCPLFHLSACSMRKTT